MFNKIKKLPGEFLSTACYIGHIKFAPGTFGSLFGLILSFFVIKFFPFYIFCLLTFIVNLFGYITVKLYINAKYKPNSDPSEVVIDEVAGQTLSIMISILLFQKFKINIFENLSFLTTNHYLLFIFLGLNFILFRFFDITKLPPVSYFDNKNGAFYIMADDIMAGIMSGILSFIIIFYFF